MDTVVLSKISSAVFTLLGVATLVFLLFNFLGNPAQMMVDQNMNSKQLKK